jgi:hypothetical protein
MGSPQTNAAAWRKPAMAGHGVPPSLGAQARGWLLPPTSFSQVPAGT